MHRKIETVLLVILVLLAVFMIGNQAWAQGTAPCETTRIYSDVNGAEQLKTKWDSDTCELVAVYNCEGLVDGECIDWGEPLPRNEAYICYGEPEAPDYANCYRTNSGPKESGLVLREWGFCLGGWCW